MQFLAGCQKTRVVNSKTCERTLIMNSYYNPRPKNYCQLFQHFPPGSKIYTIIYNIYPNDRCIRLRTNLASFAWHTSPPFPSLLHVTCRMDLTSFVSLPSPLFPANTSSRPRPPPPTWKPLTILIIGGGGGGQPCFKLDLPLCATGSHDECIRRNIVTLSRPYGLYK